MLVCIYNKRKQEVKKEREKEKKVASPVQSNLDPILCSPDRSSAAPRNGGP